MRKQISLLMITLFVLAMCGCGKEPTNYKLELDGNASTGYAWSYAMSDEGIVTEVENTYVVQKGQEQTGADGIYRYIFSGKKAGEVTLTFTYARSWEKDVDPLETKTVTLIVDKDKNVKEKKAEEKTQEKTDEIKPEDAKSEEVKSEDVNTEEE